MKWDDYRRFDNMKISEIIHFFEEVAPDYYQESYDNSGLQIGDKDAEVTGILITLDITAEIIDEAMQSGCNLILSHHPLIFTGIKSITGRNSTERIIIKALQEKINILSIHTNVDNAGGGVNHVICNKIGLEDTSILRPLEGKLFKLSVFVPEDHAENVREHIFSAGAGVIGNYDFCSFNTSGTGTFRGNEDSIPFSGKKGKMHYEKEIKVETILPAHLKDRVIDAMLAAHPYEEVAYDIYPLGNKFATYGAGMIGYLDEETDEKDFLSRLRKVFKPGCIRHSRFTGKKVKKVAVCGGSGSSLLGDAIAAGADVFVSSDFKYHQFFAADDKILIADIGHYESEQFTKELFYELLIKKFPNFALHLSKVNTNPIHYI